MIPVIRAADAAEHRGDAGGALDVMSQHPWDVDGKLFWRPERLIRLAQITAFGPMLPGWATSRWILAQAAVVLDTASRGRYLNAMGIALRARAGSALTGRDALDARVKVMDHDWVYRQAVLYELGGLEHFVTRVASPDLLVGADRIREWTRTPMGGFRFVGDSPRHLTWERLDTGEEVETINIGSATLLEPGECVIGRRVPIEGGALWESAPLYVPDDVAIRVADDPVGWIDVLTTVAGHARREELPGYTTHRAEFALLTDVPDSVRFAFAGLVADRGPRRSVRQGSPGDQVRDDAKQLVLAAVGGGLDGIGDETVVSPWPVVAASLLEPGVLELVLEDLSASDTAGLRELEDLLAGPAGELCRLMSSELRESA